MTEEEKKPKGFAKLTCEERRAISSRGGKAAHAHGTAYEWTPAKAREAGKLGGAATKKKYAKREDA